MTPAAPHIPDTAPFSTEQRAWLNGMLAGLFSSQSADGTTAASPAETTAITILFGSQSGNCETLAKKFGKLAATQGFGPAVTDLGDYPPENIKGESRVLIVTSTYGDGEPPDNAKAFHDFLLAEDAPRLEGLTFAVLGLGDSSYPDFNECAKRIDSRLETLGAARAHESLLCDVEFEDPAEAWVPGALKALQGKSVESSEVGGQKTEISHQPSAISHQPSAISHRSAASPSAAAPTS
ncbi:MAG: flavodoxin domain-containing protein [Opitutales bacterium]|nr:flavodoxin domain-containing protein [Opitutales bacterium]